MAQEELYERVIGGKVEYRKAPAILKTSKVARKQWAEQGWEKSAGSPIGVTPATPKAAKAKKEKGAATPNDDSAELPVYEKE